METKIKNVIKLAKEQICRDTSLIQSGMEAAELLEFAILRVVRDHLARANEDELLRTGESEVTNTIDKGDNVDIDISIHLDPNTSITTDPVGTIEEDDTDTTIDSDTESNTTVDTDITSDSEVDITSNTGFDCVSTTTVSGQTCWNQAFHHPRRDLKSLHSLHTKSPIVERVGKLSGNTGYIDPKDLHYHWPPIPMDIGLPSPLPPLPDSILTLGIDSLFKSDPNV